MKFEVESFYSRSIRNSPVKGTGQHQIVVGGEVVQAIVKLAVVDQSAGFVDDH
jgi:hypothetical protein